MKKSTSHKPYLIMTPILAIMLILILAGTGQAAEEKWTANFWNNKDLSGEPVLTRWDQTINFDWGHGSPDPAVNDDNFSARWERRVYFDEGTYRFVATMDDAMRVWIDGTKVIDSWHDSQEHSVSVDKYMTQGDHQIQVDYYEAGGVAIAKFHWEIASGGPTYPNWKGEYYNNMTLSGAPAMVRDDPYLSFNWGTGSPAPGIINYDHFSVRWTKTINTNPGNYRLWLTSDDGSRLFINNVLVINNWAVQAPTTKYYDYYYPGGPVEFRVEYFENIENATMNVGVGLIPPGG